MFNIHLSDNIYAKNVKLKAFENTSCKATNFNSRMPWLIFVGFMFYVCLQRCFDRFSVRQVVKLTIITVYTKPLKSSDLLSAENL